MALLIRQFIRLTAAQNHISTSHHFEEFQFQTPHIKAWQKGKNELRICDRTETNLLCTTPWALLKPHWLCYSLLSICYVSQIVCAINYVQFYMLWITSACHWSYQHKRLFSQTPVQASGSNSVSANPSFRVPHVKTPATPCIPKCNYSYWRALLSLVFALTQAMLPDQQQRTFPFAPGISWNLAFLANQQDKKTSFEDSSSNINMLTSHSKANEEPPTPCVQCQL